MLNLHDTKAIDLRPYQLDAVESLRQRIREGHKRLILVAPTGAGKTVIASHLLRQADQKGSYALFMVDRVALVNQTSKTLDDYGIGHGIVQGINHRWAPRENVQVCSVQTLAKRVLPRTPSLIIYDECFPGDVEVMTDEGFIRFDGLTGNETFAQYNMDTAAISFAQASRMVRRPAQGDLVRVKADRRVDLTMTAGHELIVEQRGIRRKVRADEFRPGDKFMPVAGRGAGEDIVLSSVERFLIAYQADGSLHLDRADGSSVVAFSFSKQRKIDALQEIVASARFDIREVEPQANRSANAKPIRRFMVTVPFKVTKDIWERFDLASLSAEKAGRIIAEMNRWDGHVQKGRATNWIYTTTSKRAADFYQSVCVLAGMRATLTRVVDERSDAFSDVYRLFIVTDRDKIGCQKLEPQPVEYEGDVFCVTVPDGCIVVRHHGKTLIVGNCHAQYQATLAYIAANPDAVAIGLTATPFTPGMANHWDTMVNVTTTRTLIDDGFLVEPKMYVAKSPDDADLVRNSFGEFSDESAASAGIRIVGDVVSEWIDKTHEHFGGPAKTIVFSPTVEHGRELCAAFAAAGYNFQQVSYLDRSDEERAAKIEEFRRPDSLIHGLVSCGVLTKGFDVPDVRIGVSCKPYRKSLSSHLQEIGRIMRTFPGKDVALWLDHSGNLERFALDQFDVWQNGAGDLSTATKRDSVARERNQQVREKVVCPECSGAMRGSTCTACGWERPARSTIRQVDGDMREFTFDHIAASLRPGLRAECAKDPRKVWDAALSYCLEHSRDPARARKWAYAVWTGIYPGTKLPSGWFDAAERQPDPNAYALIDRETKRFRKKTYAHRQAISANDNAETRAA